ncbi:MAG: AsmA family protein [candidate division Zixibacteria bacterium]|nr:AsmA family protein [candidate division Zixibacteria bacterium]
MKALKILGIAAGVFIVLLIAASIAAKIIFTKEKILAMVIPKIEESIHRKVAVKDASFSIFPSISVNLDSLVIKNKPGFQQEDLVRLEEFSVKLKFLPLLRKRIELKKLVFVKPEVYLERQEKEQSNYQDFLQSDKEKKIIPITFDLLEVQDGRIVYYNRPEQYTFVIEGFNQAGKLQLVDDQFLESDGILTISNFQLKSTEMALSYPLEFEYNASYDLMFDSLKIKQAELKFGQFRVNVQALVKYLTSQPQAEFNLQAEEFPLENLYAFLPPGYLDLAKKWNSSGRMNLKINGKWDSSREIKLHTLAGEIIGKDLKITPAQSAPPIEIPLLTVNLNEANASLTTSQGRIGENPIQLKAVVDDFKNPRISGEFSATLNLEMLQHMFPLSPGTEVGGYLELSTSLFGSLKKLENLNLAGTCNLRNVKMKWAGAGQPLENLNGALVLRDRELTVNRLSGTIGKSNFTLNGNCTELVTYILADKEKKAEYKPTFNFNFSSSYLNLDEILPAADTQAVAVDTASGGSPILGLAYFLDLSGRMKINKAIFREVEFDSFSADLSAIDGYLKLSNVAGKVYSGLVKGEATCDLKQAEKVKFTLDIEAQGIEANGFLSRFSSVENHLFGKINFIGEFSGEGNTVPEIQNTLTGDGKISLTEGKLVNWEFAQKMAGFLNYEFSDEEPIKDLKNSFDINDARLRFGEFTARSKTADWKMTGSTGLLDQSLDYSLEIHLSPEVSSQVKVLGELTNMLKDEQGRLLIPLKISGNTSAPKFAVDFGILNQKLQNSLKQRLEKKQQEGKENLQDKGKELLEGLFKKKKDG